MPSARPEASARAQTIGPRLHGVPMPARAFGFASGWCPAAVDGEGECASGSSRWSAGKAASAASSDEITVTDDAALVRFRARHRAADTGYRPVWASSGRPAPAVAVKPTAIASPGSLAGMASPTNEPQVAAA